MYPDRRYFPVPLLLTMVNVTISRTFYDYYVHNTIYYFSEDAQNYIVLCFCVFMSIMIIPNGVRDRLLMPFNDIMYMQIQRQNMMNFKYIMTYPVGIDDSMELLIFGFIKQCINTYVTSLLYYITHGKVRNSLYSVTLIYAFAGAVILNYEEMQ